MKSLNSTLTLILNAPRTFDRIAKRAIGALQQPAQKLSPARSATIPTYQQQQQQARAAVIRKKKRNKLINKRHLKLRLHSGQSIIELHKPECQSLSKSVKCSLLCPPRGCDITACLYVGFFNKSRKVA